MRDIVYRWLPALCWMGVIFFLSAQSSLPSPPDRLLTFILRKIGHVVVYAILALLLLRATASFKRPVLYAALIAVLYAISDELHQSFVPGREATLRDVAIDAAAAIAALTTGRRSILG